MTDKRIKKPCPFCGTKAEDIRIFTIDTYRGEVSKIRCPDCNATFEGSYTKQEVINKWNMRYS